MNNNTSINLLSHIDKDSEKQKRVIKIFNIIAVVILVFVGLSAIIVFFLNRQFSLSSLKTKQKEVAQKIAVMHKKEAKLIVINNRLKTISEILAKRPNFYKIINDVLEKVPPEVSIDKLTIDNNKISLSASSNSLLFVNNLIDNLTVLAKKKEITSLILNSLSLNQKTLRYSVLLEGVL